MSNFTAQAYIVVSSWDKAISLFLSEHGRRRENIFCPPGSNLVIFNRTDMWSSFMQLADEYSYIDCNAYANGDEELAVKLFLELAKMRKEDNRNNRFVRISEEHCEDLDVYVGFNFEQLWRFSEIDEVWQHVTRNATPHELAEAVHRGEVKL